MTEKIKRKFEEKFSKLGMKYERKRIKSDQKLPALCADYKHEEGRDSCTKADVCKNATYGFEGKKSGYCYGGTKESERESRRKLGGV